MNIDSHTLTLVIACAVTYFLARKKDENDVSPIVWIQSFFGVKPKKTLEDMEKENGFIGKNGEDPELDAIRIGRIFRKTQEGKGE